MSSGIITLGTHHTKRKSVPVTQSEEIVKEIIGQACCEISRGTMWSVRGWDRDPN